MSIGGVTAFLQIHRQSFCRSQYQKNCIYIIVRYGYIYSHHLVNICDIVHDKEQILYHLKIVKNAGVFIT